MASLTITSALLLAACGGGDAGAPARQVNLTDDPLIATPCQACSAGMLQGVAAAGQPLARAEVVVIDGTGARALAYTNDQGQYQVDVSALAPPFLVSASGMLHGEPVVFHAVVLPAEVGRARTHLTPLTELIAARVLRGLPHDLLQQGRVDFRSMATTAVRTAETELEGLLQPVLVQAGLTGPVDLRAGELIANQSGLDLALDRLVLTRSGGGYRLRHVLAPPDQAVVFDHQGDTAPDAAITAPTSAALLPVAVTAAAEIEARLSEFSAHFANGVPSAATLAPFLSSDFLHEGLGATQYLARILRESAPLSQGGFSWQGARWDQVRVLHVADPDHVLVQWRITPRAPFAPRWDQLWMTRASGNWQWQGDRHLAEVQVRHAALLGPKPLSLAEVRALPWVNCQPATLNDVGTPWLTEHCQIEQDDGMLDLGHAHETAFGTWALFRSHAGSGESRRRQAAQRSQLLGAPSAQVSTYLLFEIDRRRIDPRVVQVRVTGPGLPAEGLSLAAPDEDDTAATHWSWAPHPNDDWPAVPVGWCATTDEAGVADCADAWLEVRSGATYRFTLLDSDAQVLEVLTASLAPMPPRSSVLLARSADFFARFTVQPDDDSGFALDKVMAPAPTPHAGSSTLTLPWRSPVMAQGPIEARMDLYRSEDGTARPLLLTERRTLPTDTSGSAILQQQWPLDATRSTDWASTRLVVNDRWGHRYVHALAPPNPW